MPDSSRNRDPGSDPSIEQIDALLASPEFAEAVQSEHFREFLDRLPVGIAVAKPVRGEERIVYANDAFENVTGLSAEAIKGRRWSVLDDYVLEDDPETRLGRAIVGGDDFLGTFRGTIERTGRALLEAYVTRVEARESSDDYFRLTVVVDVVQRDPADQDRLDRELRDKDMQLREIQHRVRNSLQIITALVRLEGRNAREGKAPDFENITSRIQALSLLYDGLSASGTTRIVDLGEYLSAIASAGMRSHAKEGILLDMKVESFPVSINIAMPAGLVVNEAMTNAFKHAFSGRETGTIELRCLREGELCAVSIADDGQGLPPGTTWPPAGKIAALIVASLEENARTKVIVESDPDTGLRVRFVVPGLPPDYPRS